MRNDPLVTIGISFFNAKEHILYAIKSVFAQSYDNWELILVDDGSTDGSSELISAILDNRVTLRRFDENRGLAYRLNQITNMSSGTFIARMDADDIMHPNRIAKQVQFMMSNDDCDAVDTAAIVIDKDGVPTGVFNIEQVVPKPIDLLRWGVYLHPSIMAKHSWLIKNPYSYEYARAEDRELWIRTYNSSKILHLSEPLYFYRLSGRVRKREYLRSYKSERKVIMRFGPEMIGWPISILLYFRSICKSIILEGLSCFELEQIITRNKYGSINEQMKEEANRILNAINNVFIPGMNETGKVS